MPATNQTALRLLLADDDAVDRELFIEACQEAGARYLIDEVANGQEVLDYLERGGPLPDVVLLDFNMPVKDGRETLRDLKADSRYRHIPVFVMSTSDAHFDVTLAYNLGANLFLVKPHDFRNLTELARYLFTICDKYAVFADKQPPR